MGLKILLLLWNWILEKLIDSRAQYNIFYGARKGKR